LKFAQKLNSATAHEQTFDAIT